jgi:hypothetical protein
LIVPCWSAIWKTACAYLLAASSYATGGRDRKVGEFGAKVGDGPVTFLLDLLAGAYRRGLAVAFGLVAGFGLDAAGHLLGSSDDLLAVAAGRIQLLLDIGLCGGSLLARGLGGVESVSDPLLALVEHAKDGLVKREAQNHEEDDEIRHLRDQLGEIDAEGINCCTHRATSIRTR